jgi:alginate O-acetyltransferase complex protein AlgI
MLFTSVTFLFYFLPLTLLAYYTFPRYRDYLLLAASMVFYAWGEALNVIILVILVGFNYSMGREIENRTDAPERKTYLWAGIACNLAPLLYFKYSSLLLNLAGLPGGSQSIPLGISFFTFQAISYLVDVYRKEVSSEKSALQVAVYIMMFPHLIAGPIVRFKTIVDDLHKRKVTAAKLNLGVKHLIAGMAQKIVIADNIAPFVDEVFGLPAENLTTGMAWLGTLGYTLQIYFDFAGYSNIAIGLAFMLGIRFPKNFNYPYATQSLTEFWKCWHMALSQWFKDYVYIPMGGNRISSFITYRNLLVVFVLCGLWHGANWTFLAWGLYHGLFLVSERTRIGQLLERLPLLLRNLYVWLTIMFGWVLFRSPTFEKAGEIYGALLGMTNPAKPMLIAEIMSHETWFFLMLGLVFSYPLARHDKSRPIGATESRPNGASKRQ